MKNKIFPTATLTYGNTSKLQESQNSYTTKDIKQSTGLKASADSPAFIYVKKITIFNYQGK